METVEEIGLFLVLVFPTPELHRLSLRPLDFGVMTCCDVLDLVGSSVLKKLVELDDLIALYTRIGG